MAEEQAGSGLQILAVNTWDEDERTLKKWVADEKLRFRVLTYGRDVGKDLYGVSGVPAVVWIDRTGNVVDAEDDSIDMAEMERRTRRLLDG